MPPKYSSMEIERRWLADITGLPDLSILEKAEITDLYFENTRMRLRKIEFKSEISYKLCKKYGKISDIAEPITNIYLSENEYLLFKDLPGKMLKRDRYKMQYQDHSFSINRIRNGEGPVIVEAEFSSEQEALQCLPPPFCRREISGCEDYEAVRFSV